MSDEAGKIPDSDHILERLERIGGMGHWRLEFESKWLFWSNGVYMIHGMDPSKYTPDLESAINFYVPEDRDYVRACVDKAVENGQPYTFECRIQRPDNSIRTLFSQGEIEIDENGEKIAAFGIVHDITELREYETRFQLAVLGSSSIMWEWDIERDRLYWTGNIKSILGYSDASELPKNSLTFFNNLIHREDHLNLKNAFAEHFSKKIPFKVEFRILKKDGSYAWFMSRGQATWDESGKAAKISGTITDIHDLKVMEQKLLRSNEDLNQFASIAAHDLQQPLRSISGFLSLLNDKYANKLDDKARKYIDQATKSAENMSELVRDMLEYSRIETEKVCYKLCDTEELVADIARSLEQMFETTNVTIKAERLPQVVCDRLKIQRVFYNLIENAIKYRGPNDPVITITAQQLDNADWLYRVSDNGIGIDKSRHKNVFKMFTRLHKKTEYEGTGVGLAICKKVIDLHNGEIWIESNSDRGTTFAFTIPQPVLHMV